MLADMSNEPKSVSVRVRVSPSLRREVEALSWSRSQSVSSVIREAVERECARAARRPAR